MITLWRVDAHHEYGGDLTHFYDRRAAAEASAEQLRCWGWYADAYAEPIEQPSPAVLHELLNRPHPNAPIADLLALVGLDWVPETWDEFPEDEPAVPCDA